MFASAYGWTPSQVISEIEQRGEGWIMSLAKNIIEERVEDRRWLISVAPLSRTPQDKKSGRALNSYARKLHSALDSMISWRKISKQRRLIEQAKKIKRETGV